ncbi:MAG TPA: AmmeMemoRadiSam system protein B [Thermoplasmata archaeon]|nr:AmmeMemoRadiSam system protein B [Thermoplasmata archaeon]
MTAAPASPRPPAVAGAFYPADPNELTQVLENCFRDPRGPGGLPTRRREAVRTIQAVVVPHAGYVYSGPIAARAFEQVATERPPDSVLLLGVNHRGRGAPAALSDRDWITPIGTVPVDHGLVRALARGPIEVDEAAHAPEHSLEVELPFLQYVLPHPRIAALSVTFGPLSFLEEVADVVRRALKGRSVLLVASTDFSHYVPAAVAEREDRFAIDQILLRDATGLYEVVATRAISMCGIAPTTVLLSALTGGSLTARLLAWGHSGEAEPMREVVGYASFVLESDTALE